MVDRDARIMATTPTKHENEHYEYGEDMKKIDTATASVAEITVDTVLHPHQRAKAERALVWKLDMRLMPMIVLIYIMNYIGSSASSCSQSEFRFSMRV